MKWQALIITVPLFSCASAPAGPYSPPTEIERDARRAEELSREAADLIPSDLEAAEALLREALTADLFHGPAHNNLGVVFLKQGKLYEAAQEFEWARKLMPGAPDPRVNLALVMESAGRTEDALDAYASALEVRPEFMPAVQGMARLLVRDGRSSDELPRLVDLISTGGETAHWRSWASLQRGSGPQEAERGSWNEPDS